MKSSYIKALLEQSKDKDELTLGGDARSKEDGDSKEGTLVWLALIHGLSQERMDEMGLFNVQVPFIHGSGLIGIGFSLFVVGLGLLLGRQELEELHRWAARVRDWRSRKDIFNDMGCVLQRT